MQLAKTVKSDALNIGLFEQIIACLVTLLGGWVVGCVPVMYSLNLVDSS